MLPYWTDRFASEATRPDPETPDQVTIVPFPLGVDPQGESIIEQPLVEDYAKALANNHTPNQLRHSWLARARNVFYEATWFQHLASPATRTLTIFSGERAEEITNRARRLFGWSLADTAEFADRMALEVPTMVDGKYYPGTYTFPKDATPDMVTVAIMDRFNAEVRTRYTSEIEHAVPLADALIIASLLEREAYDFTDMRYISGIIWNRLFSDMRLQLDATLQYARANREATGTWWPVPVPKDKYIVSPFNTYLHAGLPPGPIANPSIDAIIAALNPRQTDCMFYFHTDNGTFHCSVTYEEHKTKLRREFNF